MELGNAINALHQPKAPTPSIMDLGKQLLESSREGEHEKVHELVCRGAPFTTDWLGKSALHMAAENNHFKTCEVLLKAGISKDSRTKVERTPLHLAVWHGYESIVELLLREKCDVNARDMMKMTSLHWAVENDYPNLVKLLLRYEANPYAESKHGDTPISMARELCFDDMSAMFNSHDAKILCVSAKEQQEATDSLLIELEKDNIDMKSESLDDDNSFSPNMNNSSQSPSTLHMLQQDEAPDDANKFLQTVMSCGRQIVVTDVGKEIMKTQDFNMNTNSSQFTQVSTLPRKNGDIKQKTVGIVMTNPSQKILTTKSKTLTSEEINKLYSEGKIIRTVSSPNVVTNGTIRLGKYRVQQKILNQNDSTGNIGPIKIINKSSIPTSTIGSINSGTTLTTKKIVVKTEPPQLTNLNATKQNKTIHVLPSNDKKMIQIPHNDFQFILKKMENMQKRIIALERHCGLDGSTITPSDSNEMQ